VVVDIAVDVDVNVDVDVGDIAVVTADGVVMVVMLSGFLGARMTNFNNRERLIAKIVKTIKAIEMILIRR
jgi:hypothetical protein